MLALVLVLVLLLLLVLLLVLLLLLLLCFLMLPGVYCVVSSLLVPSWVPSLSIAFWEDPFHSFAFQVSL